MLAEERKKSSIQPSSYQVAISWPISNTDSCLEKPLWIGDSVGNWMKFSLHSPWVKLEQQQESFQNVSFPPSPHPLIPVSWWPGNKVNGLDQSKLKTKAQKVMLQTLSENCALSVKSKAQILKKQKLF